jgi:hypothetical protein
MEAYWQEILDRRWKQPRPVRKAAKKPAKARKPAKADKSREFGFSAYGDRNRFLLRIGYESYRKYLDSPLWASIRQRVLDRDGGLCWACNKPATQVHHQQYTAGNLTGENLHNMVSVCGGCHHNAEIDRERGKTTPGWANRRLKTQRKWNDIGLTFSTNPEYKAMWLERQAILELKTPTTAQLSRCGELRRKMSALRFEAKRRYKAQKKAAKAARQSLDKDSRPSHGNTIPGSGGSGAVPTVQVASKTEPDSHPVAASRNHGEIVKPYPA